jgi:hypothetical protein
MDIRILTRRLSRRALRRPNLVYYLWRFVANGGRTARAMMMRRAHADSAAVGAELRKQGIAVGPAERFLTKEGLLALHTAAEHVLTASRSEDVQPGAASNSDGTRKKPFLIHLASYRHLIDAEDPLLKLALDLKLLEIVSDYLGLWPALHSIGAWLNYPTDAPPASSQLWHRDPEDLKLIKVFIYVSDVNEQSGPFTYIPKTHPFGAKIELASKLDRHKRLPDHLVKRVFPASRWRVCTGPPNTMILADTVGYHRGGKPTKGHRILMTMTYTSGTPMTSRPLRVRSAPRWVRAPIQRFAVSSLHDTQCAE